MEYSRVVKLSARRRPRVRAQAKKHLKLDVRHVDESAMPPAEFIDQLGVVRRTETSHLQVAAPMSCRTPAGSTCSQRRVEREILSGKSG